MNTEPSLTPKELRRSVWSGTEILRKFHSILIGCVLASIGIILLRHAHLVTGGTPGLALSLSYLFNASFSTVYLLVNIPFYILSIMRMGWSFTLSTFVATLILSVTTMADRLFPVFTVPDWAGALFGGAFVGVGLSYLFLNGSSLGGVNILVLYFHKRFGWDPGKITFVIDFSVVMSALYSVGFVKGAYSVLSVVILSSIISFSKGRFPVRYKPEVSLRSMGTQENHLHGGKR
ncbi:YitT family protein [Heliobacterium mobile]|uniref:YitT family protein n=1 Tax=Heliobacterium mobile TaxID=28064 RepID=UPI001479457B|nr:YitT family protein [Heliobacterium mobile]